MSRWRRHLTSHSRARRVSSCSRRGVRAMRSSDGPSPSKPRTPSVASRPRWRRPTPRAFPSTHPASSSAGRSSTTCARVSRRARSSPTSPTRSSTRSRSSPMTDAGAGRPAVAATFGVEEEYHVVDALTLALRDSPDLGAAASHGELGPRLQAEIASTQLETATGVCATLAELRTELLAARCEAAYAAESVGAALVVASTHPTASWRDQRLTSKVRYIELFEQWGLLALQQVICGCHVHVSVPDLDTAVAVMDHAP